MTWIVGEGVGVGVNVGAGVEVAAPNGTVPAG